ncbi:MAG: ATP-binding protein [Planctomycetia bacterium]
MTVPSTQPPDDRPVAPINGDADRRAAVAQAVRALGHECGNALQRGQAKIDLLRLETADRPALGLLLDQLEAAQDQVVDLFRQARAYAAPPKLNPEPVRLDEVAAAAWSRAVEGTAVDFRQTAGGTPTARVDRAAAETVFRALFRNALESPGVGAVSLTWQPAEGPEGAGWRATLADDGAGFTPEAADRAFEPFFSTKPRHLGLGLTIARQLIHWHGGCVEVRNDCAALMVGVGNRPGAVVEIHLPRPRE